VISSFAPFNAYRNKAREQIGGDFSVLAFKLFSFREPCGLDAIQFESRAVARDRRLVKVVGLDFNFAMGKRFDDLRQFPRGQTNGAFLANRSLARSRDRQVEVGGAQRDPVHARFNERVRQDRDHRFHAGHSLQRDEFVQECGAIDLEMHGFSLSGYAAFSST
jgi:hypothetical protein